MVVPLTVADKGSWIGTVEGSDSVYSWVTGSLQYLQGTGTYKEKKGCVRGDTLMANFTAFLR